MSGRRGLRRAWMILGAGLALVVLLMVAGILVAGMFPVFEETSCGRFDDEAIADLDAVAVGELAGADPVPDASCDSGDWYRFADSARPFGTIVAEALDGGWEHESASPSVTGDGRADQFACLTTSRSPRLQLRIRSNDTEGWVEASLDAHPCG